MNADECHFRAGAATVCITPDEPLWLAGYAARTAPAQGKISDLFASALVLEDCNGERLVIASADVIAITRPIADAVAECALTQHGLARHQLVLTATHTHYAPEFRADKTLFFNIPAEFAAKLPKVSEQLVTALMQAIDAAFATLEPVQLSARRTSAGFAHNRRRYGVKEGAASVEDTIDHDVPLLDCVDASGRRKAIVFGYACHNTTIPWQDGRYCADWVGFAREELQSENPGSTAIFVPGAGADQDPEPGGSVEYSRQHGHELAVAVQESFNEPGVEIVGPIRSELQEVFLPLQPVSPESILKMLESDDPPKQVKAGFLQASIERGERLITSYPMPIQVVQFGQELLLIALSGEPVIDWAQKFKREFLFNSPNRISLNDTNNPARVTSEHRWSRVWVAGYCNDMFGYVPTRRVQAEGGYEGGRANLWSWVPAPFTDDVEERVTSAVRELVAKFPGATAPAGR
jgi:neutral ceramidase